MLHDKSNVEASNAEAKKAVHWTQTAEGKEKMARAQRKAWKKRNRSGNSRDRIVELTAEGYNPAEIAKKLKVNVSTVYKWRSEGAAAPPKPKKAVKHVASVHRLAQKVRKETVGQLQAGIEDYLVDVLLLTQEILRE